MKSRRQIRAVPAISALALVAAWSSARAQDVNGVPNAAVNPFYASLSARAVFAPAADGKDAVFAGLVGYQRNFGEQWSLSGGAFYSNRGPGGFELRAFQAAAQFQFAERARWGGDGSILLIARLPDDGDGPGRVALLVAGKWIIREDWEIRALAAANREYGAGARAGVGLGTRIEATRRIGTLGRLGAQLGDGFNTTAGFGAFKDQSHQAGPVFKTVIGRDLTLNATAQFGLSEAAPDEEFRLFLTYDL